jgi:hypothetical protein
VTNELDTLATALYVQIDDATSERRWLRHARTERGEGENDVGMQGKGHRLVVGAAVGLVV